MRYWVIEDYPTNRWRELELPWSPDNAVSLRVRTAIQAKWRP